MDHVSGDQRVRSGAPDKHREVIDRVPGGRNDEELEILEVRYAAIPMQPFEAVKSQWTPNAR